MPELPGQRRHLPDVISCRRRPTSTTLLASCQCHSHRLITTPSPRLASPPAPPRPALPTRKCGNDFDLHWRGEQQLRVTHVAASLYGVVCKMPFVAVASNSLAGFGGIRKCEERGFDEEVAEYRYSGKPEALNLNLNPWILRCHQPKSYMEVSYTEHHLFFLSLYHNSVACSSFIGAIPRGLSIDHTKAMDQNLGNLENNHNRCVGVNFLLDKPGD
uniref:Uncharacterized protein n=1 Tax=Oryza meridionalis TaxID=40149 RepID=A0A0E0F4Z4_9ORYZ